MGDAEQLVATVVAGIADIDAAAWDACAGAGNVFASHAFLNALEASGSVAPATGWAPHHIVLEQPKGGIVGAVPLYVKNHSYGEYVFDHSWAHAYAQAGGHYYPKLQAAIPFTPVTGSRLLCPPGPARREVRLALIGASVELARRLGVSSLHFTFPARDEWQLMGEAGLLLRTDQQFHWLNHGFASFDDFLATLTSRKRKAIRRERKGALAGDVAIETLTGGDITEKHWDAFHAFYMDTGGRKWGRPYLNREFFSRLGAGLADKVVLVMCRRAGRWIAGALNLVGGDTLYGRYWGALEDHRFLHFETCYYRAIDFAIATGLGRVEAGAQGPHKLARGYMPCLTHSAHWIRDPGFREAVRAYLVDERRQVDGDIEHMAAFSPFKRQDPGPEDS